MFINTQPIIWRFRMFFVYLQQPTANSQQPTANSQQPTAIYLLLSERKKDNIFRFSCRRIEILIEIRRFFIKIPSKSNTRVSKSNDGVSKKNTRVSKSNTRSTKNHHLLT